MLVELGQGDGLFFECKQPPCGILVLSEKEKQGMHEYLHPL